eukprot:580134-Rhodomonas_salina.1
MQAARTLVKYAMDMSKYPCRRRGIIISNERREIMSEPGIGQVQFRSDGYWHVGVYIGNGLVIHFVANEKGSSALTGPGCVKIDRLEDIAQLYDVTGPPQFMPPALAFTAVVLTWAVLAEYVDSPDPKRRPNDPGAPPRHDLDRLQWSDLSVWCDGAWGSYNVATHNCENFAHQCIYGKPPKASDQTKGFLKMAAVGAGEIHVLHSALAVSCVMLNSRAQLTRTASDSCCWRAVLLKGASMLAKR